MSSCGSSSTGCKQVIMQEHACPFCKCILMHFDRRLAIFQCIVFSDFFIRKFASLPYRNKRNAKFLSDQRTEDETARLDGGECLDISGSMMLCNCLHHLTHRDRIVKQWRNVLEKNACPGKVVDVAEQGFDFFCQ